MSFYRSSLSSHYRREQVHSMAWGAGQRQRVEVESGQILAPGSNSLTMGAVQGGAWDKWPSFKMAAEEDPDSL